MKALGFFVVQKSLTEIAAKHFNFDGACLLN